MDSPLVSVIMPVYNAERYVADAIESILNQTLDNFEFLIFDDGSTDQSKEIISSYALRDKRIIPFYSEINLGYVVHLNEGIRHARAEYIARMDSDDISMSDRFSRQAAFLKANPEMSVVGASSIRIDEAGKSLDISIRHSSPRALFWFSFFTNPLAHPSVMFRKSAIIMAGMYDPLKMPSEDFDLWVRVLRTSKVANIGIPLIKYREHRLSISNIKKESQTQHSVQTLKDHWWHFLKKQVTNDVAQFFRNYHKGFELEATSKIRPAYYLILELYFVTCRRYGFANAIEKDAFNKLCYLVLRASGLSVIRFLELGILLAIVFPFRLIRKIVGQ